MKAVGSIKIKAPLTVDQVCRGTKQIKTDGTLFGFHMCQSADNACRLTTG